jgi:peptide/nickel transport system substrate-binding protein
VPKLSKIFFALTRREKAAFAGAVSVGILALAALGIVFIQTSTKIVPSKGGEYTEGMVGQPTHVNPVLASSETDRALVHLLFASVDEIAEKIESSNAGKTWKVRLKEGLAWSDGHKLTSDDVIFTIQKIQDPETQSPLFASWQGVSAQRLSELEIQFNLVGAYPFFGENLQNLFAIPKHLFADTPAANWKLSAYDLKPVSSGPYIYETSQQQSNGFIGLYRLRANPKFAGEAPLIETFQFKFFPRLEDLLKSFNTGLVDGFGTFDPGLLEKMNRPYATHSYRLPSYYAAFFNQTQNPALKDAVVRSALIGAIDRQELVDRALEGKALPVDNPISPVLVAEDATTTPSLDQIAAALDAAGWKQGEDGIRAKTQGKTPPVVLQFTLTLPKIPFLSSTANYLVERWQKLGAKVELVEKEPEELMSGAIKNRDYQVLLFGNVLNPPADLYSFWHSNQRFYPGLNLALYSSKQADALIESVRREPDADKRRAALGKIRETIIADAPAVFLYSPDYLYLSSKDLKGVNPDFITEAADRYRQVAQWHLRTTRALK